MKSVVEDRKVTPFIVSLTAEEITISSGLGCDDYSGNAAETSVSNRP